MLILSASFSTSLFASAVLCACSVAPCATLPIASVTCWATSLVSLETSITDLAIPYISSEFVPTFLISPEILSIIPLKLCSNTPNSSCLLTSSFVERSPFAIRFVANCSLRSSFTIEKEIINATISERISAIANPIPAVALIVRILPASSASSPISPIIYQPVMVSLISVTIYFSPLISQLRLADGFTSAETSPERAACAFSSDLETSALQTGISDAGFFRIVFLPLSTIKFPFSSARIVNPVVIKAISSI